MARCEQGYLCDVCGEEVASIRESDLYLRFVTGQLPAQRLLATPERHIRCNPTLAQFIEHEDFDAVIVEGDFSKHQLDDEERCRQAELLTRGWERLQEIAGLEQPIPIAEYPLQEYRTQRS
jgi:hypothetical protein